MKIGKMPYSLQEIKIGIWNIKHSGNEHAIKMMLPFTFNKFSVEFTCNCEAVNPHL